MIDVARLNTELTAVSTSLLRGSLNYCADFKVCETEQSFGKSAEEIIGTALGAKAVLGGTYAISEEDAISEIQRGFLFAGDGGAHPGLKMLNSKKYKERVAAVMEQLTRWINGSSLVMGFWLKDGHPFYPVFWDYAYIIESANSCYVLIASASD